MTPKEFTSTYYPYAIKTQKATGISALSIMAQAALESGWGKAAPNFNFFGIKDFDGVNGNEQLITTTEYSRRNDLKFPQILSITPVIKNGQKYFKYIIKDYFRSYKTADEAFTDHANFFIRNERYSKALAVKDDVYKFIDEIANAGYATDPNYAQTLKTIVEMIKKQLPK